MPPYSRPHHPAYLPGDAQQAPPGLMAGPGSSRDAAPRWPWVTIRIGGQWRLGRVDRWRKHQGVAGWVVSVYWGPNREIDWGWYHYDPATIRRSERPANAERA